MIGRVGLVGVVGVIIGTGITGAGLYEYPWK